MFLIAPLFGLGLYIGTAGNLYDKPGLEASGGVLMILAALCLIQRCRV